MVTVFALAAPLSDLHRHYDLLEMACAMLSDEDACNLTVALNEAIANAVEHSQGTHLFMEIGVSEHYIRVSMEVPDGIEWEFDPTVQRKNADDLLLQSMVQERQHGRGYLMMLLSTFSIRVRGKRLEFLVERTD